VSNRSVTCELAALSPGQIGPFGPCIGLRAGRSLRRKEVVKMRILLAVDGSAPAERAAALIASVSWAEASLWLVIAARRLLRRLIEPRRR